MKSQENMADLPEDSTSLPCGSTTKHIHTANITIQGHFLVATTVGDPSPIFFMGRGVRIPSTGSSSYEPGVQVLRLPGLQEGAWAGDGSLGTGKGISRLFLALGLGISILSKFHNYNTLVLFAWHHRQMKGEKMEGDTGERKNADGR